jgi:hypothetical protein
MSEYCVPCGGCPCPDTSAKFVKSKCRKGDDIRSLLDSKFTFKKNRDDLGTLSCNFQARISIYGKNDDSSTFELLIPEQRQYESILECTPEYSDIFDFKFDFELQDTLDIFKNYSFLQCVTEYEVVVDIFLLTSLDAETKICDDFTQVDAIDCPSSPTTTSNCVCNFESVPEDFSNRGNYEGTCDDICKIPRCFACGNYATPSGILYEDEVTETTSKYYVNLSLDPESYPFSSLMKLKLSSSGLDVSKQLMISSAGGFESNLVGRVLLEDVSNLPADTTIDIEVESFDEECECDCLYGFKNNDDSEKYDLDNSDQSVLNQFLIANSQNYNNVNCSFGNCYMSPTSTNFNEGDKYWFRFSVAITNDIGNLWGHNCEYDMEVSLNLGTGSSIYSETLPVNMVRSIKDELSEQTDLSGLKFIEIEKTILLDNINSNTDVSNSKLRVCFKNPRNSTDDGYTSSSTTNNICECCQEYDYSYFENYLTSSPEDCTPCKKSDSFYEESMDVTKKFNDAHYIAGLKGTFLMYANYELNGKQNRVLVGNGLGETKLHKIYSDTINEDYYKSNTDIEITHDLDE